MKVSVIMPAYNAEKYIKEAILSILNQTFKDFEFIIVNDGSIDATKDIILSFNDPRIVYLENKVNSGIVVTLNKGIDLAKGVYIARMDADDISLPKRLEIQVNAMDKDPAIGALGTGTRIFGDGIETRDTNSSLDSDKLKAELLFDTCMCHPSVMMRKSILDDHNIRYNKEYQGAEDYEMWWQIARVSKLKTIPNVLHCYRIHSNQVTQKKDEDNDKLLMKMLCLRLDAMQMQLSVKEKETFLSYCMGRNSSFTEETLTEYINIISKILINNKKTNYFKQKTLQEVCALSVTYALDNSIAPINERKEFYHLAIKEGIYPIIMRLKLLVHYTINKIMQAT